MENGQKLDLPINEDNDFLEPYYKKPRFGGTFWRWLVMAAAIAAAIVFFKIGVLDRSMDDKELLASIKLLDVTSQWVQKEKIASTDFKGVVVVPQLSFRIRNVGRRDLQYVNCIAVFRFADNGKLIGEAFRMTMHDLLPPGQETKTVELTSPFGYRASSLESFKSNTKDWRDVFVELFAKSRNSKIVTLHSLIVSRKIAGLDIEVAVK